MNTSDITLFSINLADLKSAQKTWSARCLQAPRPGGFRALAGASGAQPEQNVVGVGIGEKLEGDKPTGVLAVKFFVRRKYAESELSKKEILPKKHRRPPRGRGGNRFVPRPCRQKENHQKDRHRHPSKPQGTLPPRPAGFLRGLQISRTQPDGHVGYGTGNFTFEDPIIIVGNSGSFSAAGDSGSLIFERQTNKAVGLLFAGSNTHTIANHIGEVLQALNVTLA